MMEIKTRIQQLTQRTAHPIGLAIFRMAFGVLMVFSGIRFLAKGWLHEFYIQPKFFFKYYGFEWVTPLPEFWLYMAYIAMILAAACIAIGYRYRMATIAFFILFNYFELLDKTYYLNHYYLISIISLWLLFIPAHTYASLDVLAGRVKPKYLPKYFTWALQFQLAVVYCYAGFAKLSPDWLLEAMPMKIWLRQYNPASFMGTILHHPWAAFVASWFGFLYDTTLPVWLSVKATRKWAYLAVVVFHTATWLLFPIGVFPFVMIALTLIFFPVSQFSRIKLWINQWTPRIQAKNPSHFSWMPFKRMALPIVAFQLLFPLRSHLYPGNVLWHEQGFNFSWRVMRVEKSGSALFYVRDTVENRTYEVLNSDYLTPVQEKMMAVQPDFLLQFADFIADEARQRWNIEDPVVTADVFVSKNGKAMQRFVDPTVNLHALTDGWQHKNWVLPEN